MRDMKPTRKALSLMAAAAVALPLAGCSPDAPTEGAPSGSPSVGAVDAGAGGSASPARPSASATGAFTPSVAASHSSVDPSEAPHLEEVKDGRLEAAKGYITARETAFSADREDPSAWLDEAKNYMTPEFHKQKAETVRPGGTVGAEWDLMHEEGLVMVPLVSECGVVTAAPQTDTTAVVQCALTNQVDNMDGERVSAAKVPVWLMSAGPQEPVTVVLEKSGGKWLVADDASGMAG